MTAIIAARALALGVATAVLLTGCTHPDPDDSEPASTSSAEQSPSAAESAAPVAIESVQPEPLIDLDCDDFAAVSTIGTLAGVTKQDPPPITAEVLDVVPTADIVRNAGGLACEFSSGGVWQDTSVDGRPFNNAWHGIAFYIVPNAGAWVPDTSFSSYCDSENPSTGLAMCSSFYAVGSTLLNMVVSSHDPTDTRRAAREHIQSVILSATVDAGPIDRAKGTWMPNHDCTALVPADAVTSILGSPSFSTDRALQAEAAAEATFTTENIGCQWWVDDGDTSISAIILPGGAWAANRTLGSITTEPVELDGLGAADTAVVHYSDGSQWGYWICYIEAVVDGTWMRSIGFAPDQQSASTAAIALAQAVLAER